MIEDGVPDGYGAPAKGRKPGGTGQAIPGGRITPLVHAPLVEYGQGSMSDPMLAFGCDSGRSMIPIFPGPLKLNHT
jgi:hypothetical protein